MTENIRELAKAHGVDIDDPEVARAIESTLQIGIAQEHERVLAHLRLAGLPRGGLAIAVRAIKSGAPMSPSWIANYAEATRWAAEIAAREADDEVVQAAIADVRRPPSQFENQLEAATLRELRRLMSVDELDNTPIEDLEVGG